MAQNGQGIEPAVLDDIINRLLEFRNARTVRQVQLSEAEIRSLCTAASEIFLQQPNLLEELEAPIKIYGDIHGQFNVRLWKVFTDCFNCLPVAALIDDKILCMHGGLSPDLTDLDLIQNLPCPTDVPDSGLLCDLLWSDPSREVKGWGMNDRGVSYTFGLDKVAEFLMQHDMDLVCHAHQVVEEGYEFFAERQLVTVFSAPNYCGEFDNAGAMMSVDENLMCSFQILKPADRKPRFL